MARVSAQDIADFNAALDELDRVLRGGRDNILAAVRKHANDSLKDAIQAFVVNPSAGTFQTAQSAMEVFELFA